MTDTNHRLDAIEMLSKLISDIPVAMFFRARFDDFHKLFDPDFDGVPERFQLLKPRLPRDER